MKKIIINNIKKQGIKAVFRHKVIEAELSLYQIDFYGVDDKYHSFLVPFNSTRIFNFANNNLLGELSNDAIISLDNNHRIFDTRADWIAGRFPDIDEKFLRKYLSTITPSVEPFTYNDFTLNRIDVTLSPIFAFIIDYSYKGVLQKKLILVADQLTDCSNMYVNEHEDFINFIKHTNLFYLIKDTFCHMEVFDK